MKKTIRDFDLCGKKVIIRVDFNVPIKNGEITDDNRIIESLKTIKYAIEKGAKVILMSHLGRIKTLEDKDKNTLEPVAFRLSELLNQEVIFVDETKGNLLENEINKLENGQVLLMENTRFEDLDGKKESGNDPDLGAYWASLGDIYINDAFGTSHRKHASNVGIATHLPSGIGFLIEKELDNLYTTITNPTRPFTVILGGSKVSDKIGVIENLVDQADYILIGGGMMFTFLKAQGYEIGKSLLDIDSLDFCQEMMNKYPNKIILPVDCVCSKELSDTASTRACKINDIQESEMGLDICFGTVDLFSTYLKMSKTIIWNGPLGAFEYEKFATGTYDICSILSNLDAHVIIGGGDTAAAAIKFGFKDSYTHISTGGGASLELLEGKELPGIAIINEQ